MLPFSGVTVDVSIAATGSLKSLPRPDMSMPIDLPRLGLGTFSPDDHEGRVDAVQTALDVGYRHIDTAQSYGTETYVGRGIDAADVAREDVFIATKVETAHLGYEDVIETTEESLERLAVDTIDLLYVHWPTHTYDAEETLAAFDELVDSGMIRHVGLSNFTPSLLDEARDVLDAPIAAHQVEMHPYLQQKRLHEYAREHDHWLVAYCPIGRGRPFDDPAIQAVASRHDATPAQVTLAWLLEKENVAAVPKASGEHIRENAMATDLSLDSEDVSTIDSIEREERIIDPEWAPWNRS